MTKRWLHVPFLVVSIALACAAQNADSEDDAMPATDCSNARFQQAEHWHKDTLRGARYREKKLGEIANQCPNETWTPQLSEFLRAAREDSATQSFRIAKYYQDLSNSGRSGGLKGAETRYREVVERYPGYSKLDLTLLNLGDVLTALGNYEDAWTSYQRLINEFPTSQLVRAAFKRLQTLETMQIQHPLFDPEMSPQQNPN